MNFLRNSCALLLVFGALSCRKRTQEATPEAEPAKETAAPVEAPKTSDAGESPLTVIVDAAIPDAANAAVQQMMPEISKAVSPCLSQGEAAAAGVVHIEVLPNGMIRNVEAEGNATASSCMAASLRKMRFPSWKGNMISLSVPYSVRPGTPAPKSGDGGAAPPADAAARDDRPYWLK